MPPDLAPELDETFKNLDQAIEEFRQIKEKLKAGPVEAVEEEPTATALLVKSEATA